ncbi:MAG: hypothetical protein KAV87_39975, partial [Desulfobacteraceae bacterium]|nr:hypothetical protein [Desulfobacteraceae bacterium]
CFHSNISLPFLFAFAISLDTPQLAAGSFINAINQTAILTTAVCPLRISAKIPSCDIDGLFTPLNSKTIQLGCAKSDPGM